MSLITVAEFREMSKPKRSKYGVAPKEQRTYDGRVYASKLEASYAQQLDTWKLAKAVKGWEAQIPFVLHAWPQRAGRPGILGTYICDFRVVWQDWRVEFVECKGLDLALGRWKRKHAEAEYGIKITVVTKI